MKRKRRMTFYVLMAMLIFCTAFFAGCGDTTPEAPKEYIIQYTDDSGTHQLTVTAGMPYSIDVIPTKYGYAFAGLFDAEVGGTQYISSTGASLSPFTDKKNMVLFPQFKASEYTLFLDYQGAQVTGSREYQVNYNSRLPELPKNLLLDHGEFIGWFTEPNAEGVQVADKYGLLSSASYVNEQNFDLTQNNNFIYLYAGFEAEKHTVTFCFETGMATEEVQVPYNTPISAVVPETRVNGNAVLTWSKTQGGEVWNGRVTDELVLYAVEYAPIIELDSNGGSKINSVVARAGSTISLPTPTKDMAKFAYWEDMQGDQFTETIMPSKSVSLKAVWQAKLVFDSNGGSDVDDISAATGNQITLPTPEKDSFIFAGWYTAEKEQYTFTSMPSAGIKLKAGWYKTKSKNAVFLNEGKYSAVFYRVEPQMVSGYNINLANEVPEMDWTQPNNIKISFTVSIQHASYYSGHEESLYATKEHFYFYSSSSPSDAYLLNKTILDHGKGNVEENYVQMKFDVNFHITGSTIYVAYGADKTVHSGWVYIGWRMTNYYGTIYYPDTTNLYL